MEDLSTVEKQIQVLQIKAEELKKKQKAETTMKSTKKRFTFAIEHKQLEETLSQGQETVETEKVVENPSSPPILINKPKSLSFSSTDIQGSPPSFSFSTSNLTPPDQIRPHAFTNPVVYQASPPPSSQLSHSKTSTSPSQINSPPISKNTTSQRSKIGSGRFSPQKEQENEDEKKEFAIQPKLNIQEKSISSNQTSSKKAFDPNFWKDQFFEKCELRPETIQTIISIFQANQITEAQIPSFDHEFLKKLNISIAKTRMLILKAKTNWLEKKGNEKY